MFRRSSGSENSGDYNWRRLWVILSRKSQRRYARAWVHSFPNDLPLHEVLVVPAYPTGLSESITMFSNPANQPIEDPFLRWSQEMEAKQEEHARLGLVTSRAEPSFERFELGLLIYEGARARAELLNELKIKLKLGLI